MSPSATQPRLVLIGWIPDRYSALCWIDWEISLRPKRRPWFLLVQRRMAWPFSGSWNGWRAGWRRYNRQNRSWVVDTHVSLWSRRHGWCGVRYRSDRGSVGEVSSEGLVGDALHAIARVGLHWSPHVAIYWRGVGQVICVHYYCCRLCLCTTVHTSLSRGNRLSAVWMRHRLVSSWTKVMLLWDHRCCLQIRPLTSKL